MMRTDKLRTCRAKSWASWRLTLRLLSGGGGRSFLLSTQARNHVQHAPQVGHAGTKTIDELLQHEFAVHHRFVAINGFFGQLMDVVVLNLEERLTGQTATACQIGIG